MSYWGKYGNLGILTSASHWTLAVSGKEDNLRRSGSLEPRTILSEPCSYDLSAYLRYIICIIVLYIYIIYMWYIILGLLYTIYILVLTPESWVCCSWGEDCWQSPAASSLGCSDPLAANSNFAPSGKTISRILISLVPCENVGWTIALQLQLTLYSQLILWSASSTTRPTFLPTSANTSACLGRLPAWGPRPSLLSYQDLLRLWLLPVHKPLNLEVGTLKDIHPRPWRQERQSHIWDVCQS